MTGYLGNFPKTQAFEKFPRYPGIWGISQIPRHLGNFPNFYRYLRGVSFKDLGNFPKTQAFGNFPRYPGIWELSQISRHLGNFPNFYRYFRGVSFKDLGNLGNFPRYPGNFVNFSNSYRYLSRVFFKKDFVNFPDTQEFWRISQIPRHFKISKIPKGV